MRIFFKSLSHTVLLEAQNVFNEYNVIRWPTEFYQVHCVNRIYCSTPSPPRSQRAVLSEKLESSQLVEEYAPLQNPKFQRCLNNSLSLNRVACRTNPRLKIIIKLP